MVRQLLRAGAVALIASGCGGEQSEQSSATQQARAEAPKRPAYCFFKSEELKGWKVSVDAQGSVVLAGKAHMKDARYRPELGNAEVAGATATISPTIAQNRGYASADNWWDVSTTIPNSSAVSSVTVTCGARTVAQLEVNRPL